MMPAMDNVVRLTTETVTEAQLKGLYIKAGARNDQRMVHLALAAMEETGATPARKVCVRELNKQRARLAEHLGVELVGDTDVDD
jgi:hypothetical protein